MVRPDRVELPTFWFVARRSIQLSYGRTRWRANSFNVPSRAALCNHPKPSTQLRRAGVPNPAIGHDAGDFRSELRAHTVEGQLFQCTFSRGVMQPPETEHSTATGRGSQSRYWSRCRRFPI